MVRVRFPAWESNYLPALQVKDCGNGRYAVSYTVHVSGTYMVHVTLGHKHIKGAPQG